jgi:hypothetical protein
MLAERTGAVLRWFPWMKMGSWSCQPTINYFLIKLKL